MISKAAARLVNEGNCAHQPRRKPLSQKACERTAVRSAHRSTGRKTRTARRSHAHAQWHVNTRQVHSHGCNHCSLRHYKQYIRALRASVYAVNIDQVLPQPGQGQLVLRHLIACRTGFSTSVFVQQPGDRLAVGICTVSQEMQNIIAAA